MWRRGLIGIGAAALLGLGAAPADAVVAGHVAGYSAPPSAAPTQTATAILRVPKLNCKSVPAGGLQAVNVGARLDVAGANSGGGVLLLCSPTVQYQPFIQIAGSHIGSGLTINPGDTVTVSASEGPAGTSVTLTDGAQSQTASGPGGSVTGEDVGAIGVNCGSGGCLPPPKASTTKFSAVAVDGVNLAAAGAVQATMTDAAGAIEMRTKALYKAADKFPVKWVLSCGTGPSSC